MPSRRRTESSASITRTGAALCSIVGPPGGLVEVERAADRRDAIAEAREPGSLGDVGATHDRCRGSRPPANRRRAPARSAAFVARGVACDVRQRLGHDEVGGALDGIARTRLDVHFERDGKRCPCHERGERGVEAPVLEDDGMDAPDQVAEILERRLGFVVRADDECTCAGRDRCRSARVPSRDPSPGSRAAAVRHRGDRVRCAAAPLPRSVTAATRPASASRVRSSCSARRSGPRNQRPAAASSRPRSTVSHGAITSTPSAPTTATPATPVPSRRRRGRTWPCRRGGWRHTQARGAARASRTTRRT